ncbi:MAG: hypothetical protein ABI912_04360, partial [Actinomycetota bacterium]
MTTFVMHGLRLRTTLPLHHGRAVDDHADTYADVLLTDGGLRVVPPDRPEGREIAHLSDEEDAPLYTFVERPEGYLLRFHGTCEFSIARDLSSVVYAGD